MDLMGVIVMAKARVPMQHRGSAIGRVEEAGAPQAMPAEQTGQRHPSPFWRHFFEMLGVMIVGMIATGAIFLAIVGVKTWDEVTTDYPTQSLLAMAAGMTLPMVAWNDASRDGMEELMRDGCGDGRPGDPLLVPCLV